MAPRKSNKPGEVLSPLKPKSRTKSGTAKGKAKPRVAKPKAEPEPKPVKYQKHFIGLARTMFLAKVSDAEIAHIIGIDTEQLEWWKEEHPEFGAAFRPDPRNYGGRPTAWEDRNITIAQTLAGLGATDLEIAQAFEVSIRTIHRWKLEYPEFREALEIGKDVADKRVENSLYQRATGYSFDSEKIVVVNGEPQRVEIIEHVPPDTKAGMWWLQNRKPDTWRAVQHIKHDVEKDSPLGDWLSGLAQNSFKPVDPTDAASISAVGVDSAEDEPEADRDEGPRNPWIKEG